MAFYLMRFSYTPETWAKLMQKPEDRRDAARAYIEQVGGTLHGFWYGFGKYDGHAVYEAPTTSRWPASCSPSPRAAPWPRSRRRR